jgi:hypothetical protein
VRQHAQIANDRGLPAHERQQAALLVREAFAADNCPAHEKREAGPAPFEGCDGDSLNALILHPARAKPGERKSEDISRGARTHATVPELGLARSGIAAGYRPWTRGLGLDSMGLLEVLLACETHFGVSLAGRRPSIR